MYEIINIIAIIIIIFIIIIIIISGLKHVDNMRAQFTFIYKYISLRGRIAQMLRHTARLCDVD